MSRDDRAGDLDELAAAFVARPEAERPVGLDARRTPTRGELVEHVSFERADMRGADFTNATLRYCSFEGARLDGADFTDARLVQCGFDDASLSGTKWFDATVVGCSFAGAALDGATDFATARDLVVEVLRRGVADDDVEALEVLGAVALRRSWCWEHWAAYLRDEPRLLATARAILASHPGSGCAEALAAPAAPDVAQRRAG